MTQSVDHSQLCQWLLAVAENRDKRAFTCLFQFFAPKIKRLALTRFAHEAQAKEVIQETMTNVWRKAHLFNPDKGAATTWVYTVMRNVTFDLLRKVKTNREDTLSDDIWPLAEASHSEEHPFDDHLESNHLLAGIKDLPETQQQVIEGFYFKEMSQEQLAKHLKLPLGTIKSRLRLAIAKLKLHLGDSHHD